ARDDATDSSSGVAVARLGGSRPHSVASSPRSHPMRTYAHAAVAEYPLLVVTRPVPHPAPEMLRPRASLRLGPGAPPAPTAAELVLRAKRYRGWTPFLFLGTDVYEATLGIVGMGRIGRAMARRATGFRMKILYTDAVRNDAAEKEFGAKFVSLDELLSSSDFVTLHVPLMKETRHLIDAKHLRQMKRSAILINGSRGPVVD